MNPITKPNHSFLHQKIKTISILITEKDILPSVPSKHDVVDPTGHMNSGFTCHAISLNMITLKLLSWKPDPYFGDEGNTNRSFASNTRRERNRSKRNSDSKWAVLNAGQIAAVSDAYLDEAYGYLVDDDPDELQRLLDAGVVYMMVQGIRVYVLDTMIWRGRVKIRVEGTKIELWTALASIEKG